MSRTKNPWWIFFFVLWALAVLARAALCQDETQVTAVDKGIVHVLSEGLPEQGIEPNRGHSLLKDTERRLILAEAIVTASAKHRISPWLLVATAFREGSFKGAKRGGLGEQTAFQILPGTMRLIRRFEPLCSFSTLEASAICAAALLRHEHDNCGSVAGAVSKYVTGKRCRPTTRQVKWIVRDRQAIAKRLEALYE